MMDLLRHLQMAAPAAPDGELLGAYRDRRDPAAFEALVRRHGPMVLGVCRRLLGNAADADDAFQATFLVLVRKGGSLRRPGLLANWLYGVAHRTALRARAMNAKRRAREGRAARPAVTAAPAPTPWEDLVPLLDQELSRLPEKYRAAVVLCELEGRSRKEAAGLLGIPEGTLSSRLATARDLLARRLSRHGPALSAGALAAALSGGAACAAVPVSLLTTTAEAAGGRIAARVAALTEGVLKAMLLERLRFVAIGLLTVGLLAGSAAFYAAQGGRGEGRPPKTEAGNAVKKDQPEAAGKKREPGAVGEKRLRPGDRLRIRVLGGLPENPINGIYQVEESGKVALGPHYGRVRVSGLTLEEAERFVQERLAIILRNPAVSLTRYDPLAGGEGSALERRVQHLEKEVQALRIAVEELRKDRGR